MSQTDFPPSGAAVTGGRVSRGVGEFARQCLDRSSKEMLLNMYCCWPGPVCERPGTRTGRAYPPVHSCSRLHGEGHAVMGAVALCGRSRVPPLCANGDARELVCCAAPR